MTVVRRVLAIQAQDATAADLGIRVRGRDITARAIRTAYEKERSIVRNWYMRGTLHTIPSDDARWVLQLLSPRILAATSRRYRQLGLGDDLRRCADHLIRRVLAAHVPLTRAELTERLTTLGVPPDGRAPFHLIRHAALTGILCHGPQRAGEATYCCDRIGSLCWSSLIELRGDPFQGVERRHALERRSPRCPAPCLASNPGRTLPTPGPSRRVRRGWPVVRIAAWPLAECQARDRRRSRAKSCRGHVPSGGVRFPVRPSPREPAE